MNFPDSPNMNKAIRFLKAPDKKIIGILRPMLLANVNRNISFANFFYNFVLEIITNNHKNYGKQN